MGIEEQFVLLSLGLFTIGVRVFQRWRTAGPANWELDDYLMPLTGLVFTAEVVAAYLVGAQFDGLTNSYMTDEERAAIDPDSREFYNRQWGSKIQIIGWSFYALILWLLKFCITAFYSRLTAGLAHLRMRVRIAYVLLTVTYVSVCLTLLLSCQPFNHFWQIYPDPGRLCTPANSPAYVLICVVPNIITDVYLLSIPLPLVWGVNISLRRRLTLMLLFSGALFVVMAGTIRAVVISTSGIEGAVSGSQWACRETFVALIVTNLPIIQPLLRQGASKIGLSGLFSRSRPTANGESHQLRSADRMGNSRFGDSKPKKGSRNHPLTMQQTTAWGSDEHILDGDDKKNGRNPGGIVVAQEITVQSEQISGEGAYERSSNEDPSREDWGYKNTVQSQDRPF